MDKQAYIDAMDIPGLKEHIDGCIDRIQRLENDAAQLRYEKRQYLPNGNSQPETLEVEEARLLDQVAREFNGVRSNAEQRDARLAQLKNQDPQYIEVSDACAKLKLILEQMDSDIAYYGRKYVSGLQALKIKTAMLRFLAED